MRRLLFNSILLLGLAVHANAGVTPEPVSPIVVFGDGKTPVSTSVNVTIRADTAVSLVFQSYGLTAPDGSSVGPANVTGPAPATYAKDAYATVSVSIANLSKLGDYTGNIEFRGALVKPGAGLVIPIKVTVKGKPVLSISASGLSAYRCLTTPTCALAEYLSPVSRGIAISNRDGSDVATVARIGIALRANSDEILRESDLKADQSGTIGKGELKSIKLSVPSDRVIAGRYDGYVRADLTNGESVSSPLTLDVRDGPVVALILLLAGIVFGRILQAANSPTELARQRLLTNLGSLSVAADSILNPNVDLLLEKQIADARQSIASMVESEAAIGQRLQDIGTSITIESSLEWIEGNLDRISVGDRPAVQGGVDAARASLLKGDLIGAEATRKQAQGDLLGHLTKAGLLPPTVTAQSMTFNAIPKTAPQPARHIRLASSLAGIPAHLQQGSYPFLNALMFIALLIGLAVVGLFTLYIKNPTFGASRLFDYFGIAVWGLSADVAQRTLQGIQLPK